MCCSTRCAVQSLPVKHKPHPVAEMLIPPLANDRVALVPIERVQRARLHELLILEGGAHRWRGLDPGSPAQSIERLLTESVLSQFAIADGEGNLCGLVQCLLPNFAHGTAQLGVALSNSYHRRGWPLEAVALFVNHLFCVYPLRKIYVEVPELNLEMFGKRLGVFFAEEGTLWEHEWHLGAYRSVTYFAMTRDAFQANESIHWVVQSARENSAIDERNSARPA